MSIKPSDPLGLARRIRAAGLPIFIAEDDGEVPSIPSGSLAVWQTGGVLESTACECPGGTALIIQLILTVKEAGFAICYFDLELPWEKIGFRWLEDPRKIGGISDAYYISDHLEFDRAEVINHRADPRKQLPFGKSIAGALLGLDTAPIPADYRNGTTIPATVIVGDQMGREFRARVTLSVNRREKRGRQLKRNAPSRGSLFEKADFITK
jgi:hypothetical protein